MMRTLLAALALCALSTAASAQPVNDPLAPAREGQLQCYTPNVTATGCRALASYAFAADGSISNTATVVLQPSPLVLMTISSPVTVRDGSVCGPIRQEDLDAATYQLEGVAATPEQTTAIRNAVNGFMAPLIGLESCASYAPQGDVIAVTTRIADQTLPETMSWVRASDGYTVRGP